MAASGKIQYDIGADTSALSSAFAKAASVAAAAGKEIDKKLGLKDALKSSVLAFGLSIEKISEKVAELFTGGGQSEWQRALDAANRSAQIMDESTMSRLSAMQQIAFLELKIQEAKINESNSPRKRSVILSGASALGITPGKGMLGTLVSALSYEKEADVAIRVSEASASRRENEAKIEGIKKAQAKIYEQWVKAEEQLDELGMSSERRHKVLLEDAENLKKDRDEAIQKNREWMPLQIAYTQKLISAGQVELQIAREQTAERQKQAAIMEKLQRAGLAAGSAVTGKYEARNDALRFTLDEAVTGTRGTAEDRKMAMQIVSDEQNAKKAFDLGHRNSAKFYADRAELLRMGFDGLKQGERTPFASVDEKLDEAVTELKALNEKLEKDE